LGEDAETHENGLCQTDCNRSGAVNKTDFKSAIIRTHQGNRGHREL
jgi:hypothetical protein